MSETQVEEYKYIVSIRFENTKKPYTFGTNNETLEYGDFVVVETSRGCEMGEIISSLRERSSFQGQTQLKPILRKATTQDKKMYKENVELAKESMQVCMECIQKHALDMNLISCEYTLDRSKVIFVYVSENRVDFRELLKDLTQTFKCRIELRQIGPRDKAKMVGGLGLCGLETCCSRFLNSFDVVSINMAKNQLLPLNIPKLSGQCGKLMCCLKFEDEQYKEMRQGLPKMNSQIEFEGKMYRLTSMNVITKQCKIENRENALFISIDELMKKGKFNVNVQNQQKPKPVAVEKILKEANEDVIADNVKEFVLNNVQDIEKKTKNKQKKKPQQNNKAGSNQHKHKQNKHQQAKDKTKQ